MTHERSPRRTLIATVRLVVLALLGLASPGSAQDLLHCEDAQGRRFVIPGPCPPGSTYLGRQSAGGSVPVQPPGPTPGKPVTDPSDDPLDPSEAARLARAVRMARFQRALTGLITLRLHSFYYYSDSGEWPTRPQQLDLDPDTLSSEDIAEIDFRKDGTIEAQLRPDFGDDKRIWLHPKPTLGGAQIRWDCRTNVRLPNGPLYGTPPCQLTESD